MGLCGSSVDDKQQQAPPNTQKQPQAEQQQQAAKAQDKPLEARPEIAANLKNVPLLSKLKDTERDTLASAMKEKQYKDGQNIVVEGDAGTEFYIIKSGQAVVLKRNNQGQDTHVAELKAGDYFGETALINNTKRGATIQAAGVVVVYALEQSEFNRLFGSNRLNITFAKRTAVSAETNKSSHGNEGKSMAPDNAIRDKSNAQLKMIMAAIKTNILFQNLTEEQRTAIVQTMWLREVPAGVNVIQQGDLGDFFYVVESGEFHIFVQKDKKSQPIHVATRVAGSSFGELALMYNAPRAATVTAVTGSAVWAVDRWTFRKVLTAVTAAKLKEYEQFLRGVQSFEVLLENERAKIAESLEEVIFPAGHVIVKQGEPGDTFFIIKSGEVVVTKTQDGQTRELTRYHAGNFFGERALVKDEPRAATCTAVTECHCLYLNREAFTLVLGSMADIFATRVEGYNAAGGASSSGGAGAGARRSVIEGAEENHLDMSINLSDLKVIGTLGKGSFGHVQLVKDRTTRTYALKTVSKAQVVQLGQQEHIMSEKKVMASLNHPFLIRLFATFKDKNCLYFLLEPSLGGELFSVLRSKTCFDENTARFYAAAVVLAFEYMHSKGIIYRDLKPENLLLDDKGYLKITDFGFAKKVHDQRTWTLCGTPDYLAPEVVSGSGHGKGVDWWTLGILIYEMLASYPPFYDEEPMKTYAKIMHGQVAFPMHFSKNAVDLIKRLLHPKATKRYGVVNGGAALIKAHPWFQGFDWDAFLAKKMPAPIILPVKSAEDLSNFETYEDDGPMPEYIADPKNPDWDKEF